ncbi:heavy metal translocating P-type ATPase [Dongshaea marina]|uniref:heavy metal translocating P-type ATPase n=1 Tax=Dongshaea marina TaxID=2047966 RepID=UPI0018FFE70D|nr:heavy metal translocating P-type ATPase [Dongshaea marina]
MSISASLQLTGLRCQNCASALQAELQALCGVKAQVSFPGQQLQLELDSWERFTEVDQQLQKRKLTASGQQYQFSVDGMSCNGCASKLSALLKQLPMVLTVKVSFEESKAWIELPVGTSTQPVIDRIQQAGYQAQAIDLQDSDDRAASNVTQATEASPAEQLSSATKPLVAERLQMQGVSCASCVSKIEKALKGVPGVESAVVNLVEQEAEVSWTPQGKADVSELIKAVERAGYKAYAAGSARDADELVFSVANISCASCVNKIESAVKANPGVSAAMVNLADKTVTVKGKVSPSELLKLLSDIGYPGQLLSDDVRGQQAKERAERKQYLQMMWGAAASLVVGAALMLWDFIGSSAVNTQTQQWAWGGVGVLVLLILIGPGGHFYKNAWSQLKHGSANMDTLVSMGISVAWLYSMFVVLFPQLLPVAGRHVYFEAATFIVGLINLGHGLGLRARGKTSEAVKKLIGLQPKTARVIRDGEESDLAIEEVVVGDRIRIRPGDKIPVDGRVIEGHSTVDESMLTGEPIAVKKELDSQLSAGTINKNGTLIFRAEKVGADTALANIIRLVRRAQNSKLPIAQLTDKIAAVFVPAVILVALISAVIWYVAGPAPALTHALIVFTTVLIIACPCALGLATPLSIITGVGKAAQLGLLVRNGEALQSASKLDTIIVDKTGTLTEGKPSVTEIVPLNGYREDELLRLAASLEQSSEHPLAEAIVESAKQRGLQLQKGSDFRATSGLGVEGRVGQQQIYLGNEKLMSRQQIDTSVAKNSLDQFSRQGKTAVYLAVDGVLAGIIVVADAIRGDSLQAIARLHRLGVKVVMATGDNPKTAAAVADKLAIDDFRAEMLPEHKSNLVYELQQQGLHVGMIGDGINDAPALAKADVGFAVGTGTDVAIESADIALMRPSLHGLADAIELSRGTLRNIKENLFFAFIYNGLGIPIAAGVLYPFVGILLSPIVAGGAMAFSSFTVVTNANRLRRFKPKTRDV